jgi:Predicted transcriptional regulator containing an HTH domain and an uncharacterized domain shared with the mammalian protein Schlafen
MDNRDMDRRTLALYTVMLVASVVVFVLEIYYRAVGDALITLPIIAMIVLAIFSDKQVIHIPPLLVVLAVAIMYISLVGHATAADGPVIGTVLDMLIGMMLGLTGLIVVYALLRELPGFDRERPALVSLLSFTFSIAMFALWKLLEFYIGEFTELEVNMSVEGLMKGLAWMSIGAVFISAVFYAGRSSAFFDATVIRFLKKNSETIGIQPVSDSELVLETIKVGENDKTEFKSTLRTNLQTGDKDKRMEKAVLKTIVAFLNTDGGTLLIGVSDDGSISGIDENSFENRDKMNLHMTNLISGQIGNEFLPFINFRIADFDTGAVMRVVCEPTRNPVFLKDGNVETFYVRSGPSSVELSGMDLISYVNNRKKG